VRRISVKFNHSRQEIVFVVHGTIETFRKRNDCDANYNSKSGRETRRGIFGYIHIPNISLDLYWDELIAHEIQHSMIDWVLSKAKSLSYLAEREEQIATMTGEIVRKFKKEYNRTLK
jgi:hypothetical protein